MSCLDTNVQVEFNTNLNNQSWILDLPSRNTDLQMQNNDGTYVLIRRTLEDPKKKSYTRETVVYNEVMK
jgi:hypothetical protein